MTPRTLIAGCGYVGSRLAELLLGEGGRVWGLRRDPSSLPRGVRPIGADVTDPASLRELPSGLDGAVYAVSPAERTEGAYRDAYVSGLENVIEALGIGVGRPPRMVVVTSTGVYGYDDGRWVDEETEPIPPDGTSARMLEGEAAAREVGGVVLRLGGIYGPGRTRLVRRVLEGEAACPPPRRYANRIHRDDAAGALLHLLRTPDPEPIYLGVDRDPAPLRDVYRWIAARAGVADPCGASRSAPPDPDVAAASRPGPAPGRGRRGSNKRCSSDRLVASGFTFLHPTYREGYEPLVDAARRS